MRHFENRQPKPTKHAPFYWESDVKTTAGGATATNTNSSFLPLLYATPPADSFGVLRTKDMVLCVIKQMCFRSLWLGARGVAKIWKALVDDHLSSDQVITLPLSSMKRRHRMVLRPYREPKAGGFVEPRRVKWLAQWNLIRVLWLHDWGTLFDECEIDYDIVTGQEVRDGRRASQSRARDDFKLRPSKSSFQVVSGSETLTVESARDQDCVAVSNKGLVATLSQSVIDIYF